MKLRILSDLHVEFAAFTPPATAADVVVLAGDIHVNHRGPGWARAAFPRQRLIYVAGNHEFYRGHWEQVRGDLHAEAARHDVIVLEDAQAEIDGVRFLGTTLWTDFDYFGAARRAEAMAACVDYLADFRAIHANADATAEVPGKAPGLLTPSQVRARHFASRAWLEAALQAPWDGPTVVITHHMPSSRSVAPRYASDLGNAGFASRLDHMMGRAALWVHGHTHDSFDYMAEGTRVLCNPRGYPLHEGFENPDFDPGLTVEV
jgi:predicted phosphodiesterase